jgi:hypothetical protein
MSERDTEGIQGILVRAGESCCSDTGLRYLDGIEDICRNARRMKVSLVELHKSRLGRQHRCFTGSGCRFWVWRGSGWEVYVSNIKGVCFEVRRGMDAADAMRVFATYQEKMCSLTKCEDKVKSPTRQRGIEQ